MILDGNRRFARSVQGYSVSSAYLQGARKVSELLTWCQELDIPEVTLWVLSEDNLDRPTAQLAPLIQAVEEHIVDLAHSQEASRTPRQIRSFGHLDDLPDSLRTALDKAQEITARFTGYSLNIAVAYGGRQEIVHAIRGLLEHYRREGVSLREAAGRVNAQEIESHLYLPGIPDPDLIIRTSGEVRLSGFLLWQSAYTEFYFCDAYWPVFRSIDFLRAIRSFQQRRRRFGQ